MNRLIAIGILVFSVVVGLAVVSAQTPSQSMQVGALPSAVPTPVLDALDKRAIDHTVALSVDAQTACDALTVSKRFTEAQQVANFLIEGRYPGYRYDWSKKALVLKAAK